jgi:2-oxoglutarate ferredoxin oxidoreductase subunit alpha
MPVFVLSDLDLGMNNWMSDPFAYPEKPWDRGKVLDDEALAKLAKFERYRDVDGDGIPYRTLPGSKDWKGTYFTRGSGHDEAARYTEDPNAYVRNMDRLKRKLETARTLVPVPEVFSTNGAEIGLIAYGSSHWAVVEARAELAASGVRTSYMRVRGMPLPASVAEFVKQHDRVYVIEQNRDGQLTERIRLESPERATRIRSVLHYDGLPLDARSVVRGVLAHEGVVQGVVK